MVDWPWDRKLLLQTRHKINNPGALVATAKGASS
jgi:hypothetical protein